MKREKLAKNFEIAKCTESLTFGTETIFVSDVANFNELAIGSGVRVASLHDLSFGIRSAVLEVALLISSDAV